MTQMKLSPASQSWIPKPYMIQGIEWLLTHSAAALWFKPGMKKTSITLKALSVLKEAKLARRALVVAPLRPAALTWPGEQEKWGEFEKLRLVFCHGKDKDYLIERPSDVVVTNYESLEWIFGDQQRFKRLGFDTLVIDESSKVRNRSNRFKLLKNHADKFTRRWELTGTPSPRDYLDIFRQMLLLDGGRALGRFIAHYRMQYFFPCDPQGWRWELKPGAKEQIEAAIAPYVLCLSEEDAGLKLPEEIENVIRVDLPKKARKLYDELEAELIITLREATITAVNRGVLYGKCAQLANGGIFYQREPGHPREWANVHNAKAQAVKNLLRDLDTPAMIVYDYEHDLDRLERTLGKLPRIGGGVDMKTSGRLQDEWNAGKIDAMLVHAKAMAHGLNFQYGPGNNIIWHSLPDDFEDFEQLNYRLHRDGAAYEEVFYHYIVASATVDAVKLRRLKKKDNSQMGLLAALREYAKTRSVRKP